MVELTPAEKVEKANGDYHEAIDEVMLSEDYTVTQKVAVGRITSGIFDGFVRVNAILTPIEEEP